MIKGVLIFAAGLAVGYAKAVQEQASITEFIEHGKQVFVTVHENSERDKEILRILRENYVKDNVDSAPGEESPIETPEGEGSP